MRFWLAWNISNLKISVIFMCFNFLTLQEYWLQLIIHEFVKTIFWNLSFYISRYVHISLWASISLKSYKAQSAIDFCTEGDPFFWSPTWCTTVINMVTTVRQACVLLSLYRATSFLQINVQRAQHDATYACLYWYFYSESHSY